VYGKEAASLVFKVIGGEFTAEIVDLEAFDKKLPSFLAQAIVDRVDSK
jgi:hypothetical protein